MSDTNRYPVNPLDGAAGFAEWRRDMERRLSALEGQPLVGSQMTGKDTSGNTRTIVGDLRDGYYGVATYDANGNEIFRTDERGLRSPSIPVPLIPYQAVDTYGRVSVTSTAFDSGAICFYATVPQVLHDGVWGRGLTVQCPSATTAEMRVRAVSNIVGNQPSQQTTSTVSIGASTTASKSLRWLHDLTFPALSIQFLIEVRRTSGSGTVLVSPPEAFALAGSDDDYSTAGGWT